MAITEHALVVRHDTALIKMKNAATTKNLHIAGVAEKLARAALESFFDGVDAFAAGKTWDGKNWFRPHQSDLLDTRNAQQYRAKQRG